MKNEVYFILVNNDNKDEFIVGNFDEESLNHHVKKNNIYVKWIDLKGFKVNDISINCTYHIKKTTNTSTGKTTFTLNENNNTSFFDEFIICLKHINDINKSL